MMLAKGSVLGSRYEIMEKVGSGGMATVYKAKCNLLNRFVAIKVLKSEYNEDGEFVKKFRREAQSAASLSHPNIVSIYDVGVENDIHYIVMEYIKGKTLKEIIETEHCLSNDKTIQYALQIASALDHAHKNHIIHRDIKSHNIIVREDGTVKVTDFGIARVATASTMTNTGGVMGSVHYFSPEQARGGFVDNRTDIYSLGVVMYEMITGSVPFEADTPVSVALKQIQEVPPAPRILRPTVSPAMESIIIKCLEKQPANRYQTASELIDDLRTALIMPEKEVNDSFVPISQETKLFKSDVLGAQVNSPKPEVGTIKIGEPERETEDEFDEEELGFFEKMKRKLQNRDDEEYDDEEEEIHKKKVKTVKTQSTVKKKKKNLIPVLMGILVVILILLGVKVGGLLFGSKTVLVPDVGQMELDKAKAELKKSGFQVVVEKEASDEVPEGLVIRQDPDANTEASTKDPVTIYISTGSEDDNKMVDLTGMDVDRAIDRLKEMGFQGDNIKTKEQDSEESEGTVVRQSIEQGDTFDKEDEITLYVSNGKNAEGDIPVPNVVGRTLKDAKDTLAEYDLKGVTKGEQFSDQYDAGQVVEQTVKSGEKLKSGDTVGLIISKGPEVNPNEGQNPGGEQNPGEMLKPISKTISYSFSVDFTNEEVIVYQEQPATHFKKTVFIGKRSSADGPISFTAQGNGTYTFSVVVGGSTVDSFEETFN